MTGTNERLNYKKYFNEGVKFQRQELRRIDLEEDRRTDGSIIREGCAKCLQDLPSDIEPVERESCPLCDHMEGIGFKSTFVDFIVDKSLTLEEKDFLYEAIDANEYLGFILDKLIFEASSFEGSGLVKGFSNQVGLNYSIDETPANLQPNQFVFNAKSVKVLGVDFLQKLLKENDHE